MAYNNKVVPSQKYAEQKIDKLRAVFTKLILTTLPSLGFLDVEENQKFEKKKRKNLGQNCKRRQKTIYQLTTVGFFQYGNDLSNFGHIVKKYGFLSRSEAL